jgi:hypothetical protein
MEEHKSMEAVVLDNIPFQPDLQRLATKLRIKAGSSHATRLEHLVDEARAIARPRALYKVAYVDAVDDSGVVLEGIPFHSRVLRVNLDGAHRVFAYVATCGSELHEWASAQDDLLLRYYADAVGEMALRGAMATLQEHLIEQHRLGRTSTMSPGSLPDWPIQAQRPLFALLGDPQVAIGVQLTASLLMVPSKSVSGIRFPTERSFASCQLCPRQDCPGRQAPYDPGLYDRRYRLPTA